ncbi:MAG: hypothetical protein CSB06_00035 [Bacteroidia bacterium]|nr:MAG: hypothetical protein CSB06_00035 [Bacteroidia bacterium]
MPADDFLTFLRQNPFVRLLFPFIAGIVVQEYFCLPFTMSVYLPLISFILLLFVYFLLSNTYSSYLRLGILIHSALFLSGAFLMQANTVLPLSFYGERISAKAVIIDTPEEKKKSMKCLLQIKDIQTATGIKRGKGKILAYLEKTPQTKELARAKIILFEGRINKINVSGNPYSFDYKDFMMKRRITGQIYLRADQWRILPGRESDFFFDKIFAIKDRCIDIYKKYGLKGSELAVLKALTLGDRKSVEDEVQYAFTASGAVHVLAVSGLHVGIIYKLFDLLLRFLNRLKKGNVLYGRMLKALLLILIVWSFALLTGMSPSVRRAGTMFSFMIVGQAVNNKINVYNSLASSAFILLIINPFLIFEVGFQLSYTAVLGIVFFQPRLEKLWKPGNKLLYYVWVLCTVSIAAQIGTFPVSVYYFHFFPNYFFITNIFAIPLVTLILNLAIALLILSGIPYIAPILAIGLRYLLEGLIGAAAFISHLPFSHTERIPFTGVDLVFVYFLIVFASVFFIYKNYKYLKISLLSILCWMTFSTVRKIYIAQNDTFIVFNVKKETCINFIGEKNILVCRPFVFSGQKFTYAVEPYHLHVNKLEYSHVEPGREAARCKNFRKFKNLIHAGKYSALLLRGDEDLEILPENIKVDFLIIGNNMPASIKEIRQRANAKVFILDSSNDYFYALEKEQECKEVQQKVFNVLREGAFVTH